MGTFFDLFSRSANVSELPVLSYNLHFSLDRLLPGVDNVRHDVQLSPGLRRGMDRAAFFLMARHTGTEDLLRLNETAEWKKVRDTFQDRCGQVLTSAVHKAKSKREVQIDHLARAALARSIREAIAAQFEKVVKTLEQFLRSHELSVSHDLSASLAIKEKLSWIRQHRRESMHAAAAELFAMAAEVCRSIDPLREATFGAEALLPGDFFSNPMIHADTAEDDGFLMDRYALLSHRFEDPDSYERLITMLGEFLRKTGLVKQVDDETDDPRQDPVGDPSLFWMMTENVDILFDASRTDARIKALPRSRETRQERRRLRQRRRTQQGLLRRLYRHFRRSGLIFRICAGFEVKALAADFCPPLVPQQVLRYLVEPSSRKRTAARLSRLKGFYGRSFSLAPLHKTIRSTKNLSKSKKKTRLLTFVRILARYHRDLTHFRRARAAMESVNLDPDERTLHLSRENRTLYDFLLPDEQGKEEQPIIGHVIVKADVRGSTDLTYRMRSQGLNPASFFSLNLFDPISEILFDYEAAKEFLEGDALILSIFEKRETPEGWYSVGRACGLALRILSIVQQSNLKSRRHRLPMLELGIGICYNASAPAFLFDGTHRIMISPAINRADRLSGCDKHLRTLIEKRKLPFNLYVFQTISEKERGQTADDLFFRYNVNGIELNAEGFRKLSEEIRLTPMRVSLSAEGPDAAHRFYTGRVPLVHGRYQPLVIREAPVFDVDPESLSIRGKSTHWYYEVCTHPRLCQKAEALMGRAEI